MSSLHKRLPPLDLLIAFEAAARYSSFTRAASELNVTQSAVSQRIRNLEESLGIALFERGHRSVRLTASGRAFYSSVSLALMHLLGASEQLRADEGVSKLVVATDTSVAAMWLASRLHRFQQAHGDVAIHLIATDDIDECFGEAVQLAIVHGDGNWPGYECRLFFEEEVLPVCAPDFLAAHPGLSGPQDLSEVSLLDLEYEHWNWMNWSIWLTEFGARLPIRRQILRSNSYPLLIEAARRGQGVALGWRRFIDEDLLAGTLVAPIPATVKTRFGYYLVRRANQPVSSTWSAFHHWLNAERDAQTLYSF